MYYRNGFFKIVTVIASALVLTIVLWFSSYFESLPQVTLVSKNIFKKKVICIFTIFKAILAAVIISALISLLKKLEDLKYYWKVDKLDFVIPKT